MRIYQNKTKTAILLINLKAASTSAATHCRKGEISQVTNSSTEYRKVARDPLLYKLMIVREPYQRIESFYKSRFYVPYSQDEWQKLLNTITDLEIYQCPLTGKFKERKSGNKLPFWVRMVNHICEYFDKEEYFAEKIDFEQFVINGVGKGYHGLGHLYEHTRLLERSQINAAAVNEIIKLENPDFTNLNSYFNINFAHENKSSIDTTLIWTSEMRQIAYEKYKKDFEEFKYTR